MAPTFQRCSKNPYQWLVVDHFADMNQMIDDDTDTWSLLFSKFLNSHAHAPFGLHKEREITSKLCKGAMRKIVRSNAEILWLIVTSREFALVEIHREFLTAGKDRNPMAA